MSFMTHDVAMTPLPDPAIEPGTEIEAGTKAETERDQLVVLGGVGWDGYSRVLKIRGERCVPRMVYLDGNLYLMSPSFPHEHFKKRLGSLVEAVAVGLGVPCTPAGSTTFRRRARRGGVEGDETYYLANEPKIRDKNRIDLRRDPPPDLAIEVVWSHEPAAAIEVYRRLKVPELWIHEDNQLKILLRQPNGRFAESEKSAAFPVLTAAEITAWLNRPRSGPESDWIRDLHLWVRDVLVPRHQDPTDT